MAAYYVTGIIVVIWAVLMTAAGLSRDDFPRSVTLGRAMIGVSAFLIAGTLIALLATTHKEHPREEAKAEAAEKAEAKGASEQQGGAPPAQPRKASGTVKVAEKEYSLKLVSGNTLKPGSYTFAASNVGKIPHDLAIQGGGIGQKKTPLIDPGKSAELKVDLKPGQYKFYCSVPGHEQLGMKQEVKVD
jgi:uncharacterized cupredoxin-like copper-binding protein